jgi:hypothetical protein
MRSRRVLKEKKWGEGLVRVLPLNQLIIGALECDVLPIAKTGFGGLDVGAG